MITPRRFSIVLALAFVALAIVGPTFVFSQAANDPNRLLVQGEKDRFAAMIKNDSAALEKLIADDVTYVHGNARVVTKAEFIGELKSGVFRYVTITMDEKELKVRVVGNVAVVNGAAAMRVVDHGNEQSIRIRYTNVQVSRDGRWQMIAWQATRLP